MTELTDLVGQFEDFQNYTIEARALSERDQNYDDHHQWTDDEIETLNRRNQAAVVINRIKVKVNRLVGLQKASRTQPRALARTPQHQDGADAVTEAIRYVVDNTDFEMKSSDIFREIIVPGYGGAIVEFTDRNGEKEIIVNKIPWDRYYYDPHSRELDFSDKKFDGIVIWMDRADAIDAFPDKELELKTLMDTSSDSKGSETFDDKPRHWVDPKRDRIRIAQHFFKEKGVWKMAFFTESFYLQEPADSPYLDEFSKPQNPIESQTAYIDRELQRYGEVRSYIWLQDEVNHRRSRLLYAGSVNRTMGEDGAVDDVNEMKQELAKADGHIKTNKGFEFEVLPNDAISETQLLLYRESKAEIDDIGINDALAGRGNSRSGRQDQIQQQAGRVELASLYDGHKHWEKRIYRQIFNRIKQGWNAEKWIRVTDDKTDLKWVGLNQPVTKGDLLLQAAQGGDEMAAEAQAMLQQMVNDPRLNEVAEVKNEVTEMDVDIILTEAPDTHTLRQETFDAMMALAERYGPENVPFSVALELSDLPNKKEAKELLNPPVDPQQQQIQELMFDLDVADKKATIGSKEAKAAKDMEDAKSQAVETEIVKSGYANLVADRDADSVAKKLDNIQKAVETEKLATEPTQSVNVNV
ncbi:MAG: hypothetical protein KOO63_08155 [Bacteroidales bacterium]|nr:hypothetical protein [Candidatus Latescibacterota bacterium]